MTLDYVFSGAPFAIPDGQVSFFGYYMYIYYIFLWLGLIISCGEEVLSFSTKLKTHFRPKSTPTKTVISDSSVPCCGGVHLSFLITSKQSSSKGWIKLSGEDVTTLSPAFVETYPGQLFLVYPYYRE